MAARLLATKTVLITGAAGGLGRAIADACFERWSQCRCLRRQPNAARRMRNQAEREGPFMALKVDVSDEESAAKTVEGAVRKFRRLDVLINSAASWTGSIPWTLSTWQSGTGSRPSTSPVLTSCPKCALKHFLAQSPPSGNIVNIRSLASLRGATAGAAYTASKHGLIGLTRNTAASYMKQGIRCNIVLPGGMLTNMASSALQQGYSTAGLANVHLVSAMDPGFVDVNDVSKTVIHLASGASQGPNGSIISTDNGWTAF